MHSMEERGHGSDLPKPRKKPEPPPAETSLPPLRRVEKDKPVRQTRKPDAAPVRKTAPRNQYASDTAEFPAVRDDEELPIYEDMPRRPAPQRPKGTKKRPKRDTEYTSASRPSRHRPKRRSLIGRLLRKLVMLAAVVFALYSLVALLLISKLERVPRNVRTVTSGALDRGYVRSILLIGTDSRDLTQERGRSDTIMLLTLNSATDEIGMNSFMRDAYVEIPGYGGGKLNAAYSYGGAELLMDTLESNYGVSVDDYICVSFTGFAGLIDAFGGVEITLTDAEAQEINNILRNEVNALMGADPEDDFLPGGGTYALDGKQALSYARIRYVGNADFERTSRQREVMSQLLNNAKSKAVTAVPELMQDALPHLTTNMSVPQLYLLSLRAPFLLGYDMSQQQIPADGTWSGANIGGQDVLQVDFPANTQILHDTVYSSTKTEEAQ